MSEGNKPPAEVQPPVKPVGAQRARMREFFRRRLQDARATGNERAWVYRDEILAEGQAMGLSEAQTLTLAQVELERNWVVLTRRTAEERRFRGAVFTDHRGLRKLYSRSS